MNKYKNINGILANFVKCLQPNLYNNQLCERCKQVYVKCVRQSGLGNFY